MINTNNGPLNAAQYEGPLDDLDGQLNGLLSQTISQDIASKLSDCIAEIRRLASAADKDRVAIKEPHLTASRRVDDDFRPIKSRSAEMIKRGKGAVTAYMVEQQRIADEARRKAEAEAAEAARVAEELAKDAIVGDMVKQEAQDAELAAVSANAEYESSRRIKGQDSHSRAMSLRTYYEAEIIDPIEAAKFFASDAKVQDAILSAANRLLRSAEKPESIPGITINTKQKAA